MSVGCRLYVIQQVSVLLRHLVLKFMTVRTMGLLYFKKMHCCHRDANTMPLLYFTRIHE